MLFQKATSNLGRLHYVVSQGRANSQIAHFTVLFGQCDDIIRVHPDKSHRQLLDEMADENSDWAEFSICGLVKCFEISVHLIAIV